MTHLSSMAIACVGAWRAIASGQFWASLQVMAVAWLIMLATALVLLFGDGGSSAPRSPPAAVLSPGRHTKDLEAERTQQREKRRAATG